MPDEPIPGSGQDGENPPPASGDGFGAHGNPFGARSGSGAPEGRFGADGTGSARGADFDLDADMDRLAADVDAGRIQVPPDGERAEGLSFITAGPRELAALGVEDLAGLDLSGFAQGGAADGMPPGSVLLALAEGGCEAGTLQRLSDGQVLGLAKAGRRLAALASWVQTTAVAEFAARRITRQAPGRVAGETISEFAEFASHELAPELVVTDHAADGLMRHAGQVTRRLPACLAALHAGVISEFQLKIAADTTIGLSDQDAREADTLIAAAAPSLTPGMLRIMCARTVMMIDPAAARRRKDEAAKDARVERFQEHAGTAALCGRDLPPDEVLASCAHIDAVARLLRAAGLTATLRALRVRVFLDLTQGKNPSDRLTAANSGQHSPATSSPGAGNPGTGKDGADPDETETAADAGAVDDAAAWNQANYDIPGPDDRTREDQTGTGGTRGTGKDATGTGEGGPRPEGPASPAVPGDRAAFPALINLLIPAGTLLGWSHAPGQAAGWGLLDPATTQDLAAAASHHPATRWCVTVVGSDGTATAHGCAPGRHPFDPAAYRPDPHTGRTDPGTSRSGPGTPPATLGTPPPGGGNRDGPARAQDGTPHARDGTPTPAAAGQLAALLGQLKVQLAPIAKGTCDHRHHEDHYQVSRKLKHLVKARTARCTAPGCNRQAAECDADHTIPWPDGPSCECNLGPPCRRHHRAKQAPGWKLEQTSPGVMTWTNPSGRTHTTKPTIYWTC